MNVSLNSGNYANRFKTGDFGDIGFHIFKVPRNNRERGTCEIHRRA